MCVGYFKTVSYTHLDVYKRQGTQLTMRTFHTGGVAGAGAEDITQGLPRVEELFEARCPKGCLLYTSRCV